MVLAPIYCEKCERRISPSSPITNLNGAAVGPCCTPKPGVATSLGRTDWHLELSATRSIPDKFKLLRRLFVQHLHWKEWEPGKSLANRTPFNEADTYRYWNTQGLPSAVIVQIHPLKGDWGLQQRKQDQQPNWDIQGHGDHMSPLLDYLFNVLKLKP